jgi:Oligogalacturonate lyase
MRRVLLGFTFLFALSVHPVDSQNLGRYYPPEKKVIKDQATGRTIISLTTSEAVDTKIYQTHPQWTADGAYIIFRSNRGGRGTQAFALLEKTGDIFQLTDGTEYNTGSLNVSRLSNTLYLLKNNALVSLDINRIVKDSRRGSMQDVSQYEHLITRLPDGYKESGGFTMDADERHAYIGLHWKEDNEDKWAIKKIEIETGITATVIDLPFRVGHLQANPWVEGEILYCHETGGDATQRMWMVNADGTHDHPLYNENPDDWVSHEIWVDRDHVLFNIIAHLPRLQKKPAGVVLINVRTDDVRLYLNARGRGYWHCAGTSDGKFAVADTFTGELHRINLETGEVKLLTTGHYPITDGIPDVHTHHTISPDNRRVLFNSALLGDQNIMVTSIED